MSDNPVIECVRDYILTFPELDENGCLCVDYLGDKAIEYSVEAVPCEPVVKRYTDGSCMKQLRFCFKFLKTIDYSSILTTVPEATVRPPSRIAKRRPSSIAILEISSTLISTWSPGMHISVPAGRVQVPVTSVVLK